MIGRPVISEGHLGNLRRNRRIDPHDSRLLDFLLDVAYWADDGDSRLPSEEFQQWPEDDVRAFMECQLGLGSERKVPAILCVHHDGVLYHCEELTRRQLLTKPFDLVHVDAHGDMGTGDSGWVEILERAASPDAVRRCLTTDCCNRIGIGNYVSYMALLRMPSSLTYVHNPASCDDLFQGFLNGDRTLMRIPVWSDDENAFDDAKHAVLMNPARSLYGFK